MTMAWSQEDVDALTEPASLNEKLELIKKIEMTEQEKVQMLKTKLSSEQWTAVNMKIQYQARKDPALKQDLEVAGLWAAAHRGAMSAVLGCLNPREESATRRV